MTMAEQNSSPEILSAAVVMSSDIVIDLYCQVCSEDGKYLEAEGFCVDCQDCLCKDCFKGHMRNRASRDHVLQDRVQMPHQNASPSVTIPITETCTEKCARHPDRLAEYYCRDDKSLGCNVCMTVSHRLCSSVDHIPDLAKKLLDSQEYKQFTETINNLQSKSQNLIKRAKKNATKAEKRFSDVANKLQDLRKKMNQAFDKFEEDLKGKASKMKSYDITKMQDISEKGNTVFTEVIQISADLQSLKNNNQLGHLFIQMIQLEDKVETWHTLLTEADTDSSVRAYTLEPGTQVQKILNNPTKIGKLSVQATITPKLSHSTTQPELKKKSGNNPAAQSAVTTTPKVNSNTTLTLKKISGQPSAVNITAKSLQKTSGQPSAVNITAKSLQKKTSGQPSVATKANSTSTPSLKSTSGNPTAVNSAEAPIANSITTFALKNTVVQTSAVQSAATEAPIAKEIKVRTNSDKSECWITGSALLPGSKFILADYNNNKVKLLNLETSKVTSSVKTSSPPWDITSITSDQVAFTLPTSRKVVFMKYLTDTLKMDKEMSVAGCCYAILHNNGKLIVSFFGPVKIEIMNLDGTVEWKLEQPGLFKLPSHVALSPDCKTIYVSDWDGGCVKGITLEGAAGAEYSDDTLMCPTGLAVDRLGRVLVCGTGSNNIHLLTPGLTKVKVLEYGVQFPYSLSYCHITGRLFVGTQSSNMKVCQLS